MMLLEIDIGLSKGKHLHGGKMARKKVKKEVLEAEVDLSRCILMLTFTGDKLATTYNIHYAHGFKNSTESLLSVLAKRFEIHVTESEIDGEAQNGPRSMYQLGN